MVWSLDKLILTGGDQKLRKKNQVQFTKEYILGLQNLKNKVHWSQSFLSTSHCQRELQCIHFSDNGFLF